MEEEDIFDRLSAVFTEVTMTAWEVVSALFSKPVDPMPEAKWTFIRCETMLKRKFVGSDNG